MIVLKTNYNAVCEWYTSISGSVNIKHEKVLP